RGRGGAQEPAGQRPPAAAEVEQRHSVFDAGPLARQLEHRLFGLPQRLDTVRAQTRGVLEAWAAPEPEELRRPLVVLLVRLLDGLGDRRLPQTAHERVLEPRRAAALPPQAAR